MGYDCFISYASADRKWAEDLAGRLRAGRFSVWLDHERLLPGFAWRSEIEKACEESRIVLPVLSPRWRQSEWTKFETYRAEIVVPLLYEGAWEEVATPPLKRFHYFAIEPTQPARTEWELLFSSLRGLLEADPIGREAVLARLSSLENPFFVGRERELNAIHEHLFEWTGAASAPCRVEVIAALGGSGKTTLARQYIQKFWRCYRQIFWVNCRNDPAVEFDGIASLLFPESPSLGTGLDAIRSNAARALKKIEGPSGEPLRLLVLDDAEDEDAVLEWVPKTGNCHTLITSSFTSWTPGFRRAPLWLLEPATARQFLLHRAERDGAPSMADLAACDEVAATLDYLPLALEQAATFVLRQGPGFSFRDYLRLFRDCERELLPADRVEVLAYPHQVFVSWRLAVDKQPAGARAMLRLSALMGPAPIPVRLFVQAAGLVAERARVIDSPSASRHAMPLRPSEVQIRGWKDSLAAYSLIRTGDQDDFSIHTLLRAVESHRIGGAEHAAWCEPAMQAWAEYVPRSAERFENWHEWRVALPHVEALWKRTTEDPGIRPPVSLLTELAAFLLALGRFGDALGPARRDVALRRLSPGMSDPDTLTSMELLGQILRRTGARDEAEVLLRAVLEWRTDQLGSEHRHTLAAMNALAGLRVEQGVTEEARKLYAEALAISERILPPDHRDLLYTCNGLAHVLELEGASGEAERLYRRAYEGFVRTSGAGHPDTLTCLQNLASARQALGRHDDAEKDYWNAFEGLQRALGRDHPTTESCAGNLAGLLAERNNLAVDMVQAGDLASAERLFRHVGTQRRRLLGRRHADTLAAMRSLAACLRRSGRLPEAECILRKHLWIAASNFKRLNASEHRAVLELALSKYFALPDGIALPRDSIMAPLAKARIVAEGPETSSLT